MTNEQVGHFVSAAWLRDMPVETLHDLAVREMQRDKVIDLAAVRKRRSQKVPADGRDPT